MTTSADRVVMALKYLQAAATELTEILAKPASTSKASEAVNGDAWTKLLKAAEGKELNDATFKALIGLVSKVEGQYLAEKLPKVYSERLKAQILEAARQAGWEP